MFQLPSSGERQRGFKVEVSGFRVQGLGLIATAHAQQHLIEIQREGEKRRENERGGV